MNKRWPTGIALAAAAWYASDSTRHRRDEGQGYELRGEELEVGSEEFLRATEAITMAPITHGNDIELFVNGDEIFPAMIETMRGAQRSLNFLTYLYWSGEIASEIALLDEQFERDPERSEEIDLQRWNGRPLVNELAEGLTKVARREL
jgi:cardiolipin synthase A/B